MALLALIEVQGLLRQILHTVLPGAANDLRQELVSFMIPNASNVSRMAGKIFKKIVERPQRPVIFLTVI